MSRIFKSVSLRDTPHVLAHAHITARAKAPLREEADEPEADAVVIEAPELAEAAAEAEALVAAAREQAAAIVAAAAEEAEAQRRAAYEDGYQRGYAEGQAAGEAAARAEASGAIAEAASRAENILALARTQAAEALNGAERQMVELALAVAAKVLAREAAENPTTVLPIVRAALEKVQDQQQITLRVNPGCYDFVLAARPELQAALAGDVQLAVAADSSLAEGDCVIETPFGLVDARLDTQLELVRTALRDMLP